MTIFIAVAENKKVILKISAELEGELFESVVTVRPGKSFEGYSFSELLALGLGEHEIEDRT